MEQLAVTVKIPKTANLSEFDVTKKSNFLRSFAQIQH
jgi:hypothetical protein